MKIRRVLIYEGDKRDLICGLSLRAVKGSIYFGTSSIIEEEISVLTESVDAEATENFRLILASKSANVPQPEEI